jgi:four helix bundle protein
MRNVEDLEIYRKAIEYVSEIYLLIKKNRILEKDYSLADQLKRAAVSVAANISEGYFRSVKQTQNYLEISSGSAHETITHLVIISNVYSIETKNLRERYLILAKQINAFSSSISR